MPDGVLAVYKPRGSSSADVVGRVRWVLQSTLKERLGGEKRKVKVGHGGTLDPLATGVLVLGIGKGCRDLEKYLKGMKRYRALGLFGAETTTLDSEGEPVEGPLGASAWNHVAVRRPARSDRISSSSSSSSSSGEIEEPALLEPSPALEDALADFRGEILQVPPMFSALHQNGQRLYELARRGEEVVREARPVTVTTLDLLRTRSQWERAQGNAASSSFIGRFPDEDSAAAGEGSGFDRADGGATGHYFPAVGGDAVGGGSVLRLSPFICPVARADGVREDTPPTRAHAFPSSRFRGGGGGDGAIDGGGGANDDDDDESDGDAEGVVGGADEGGGEAPVEMPCFALDVECGGGTYVRSLISDIAKHPSVRSSAHMVWLERTRQGPFGVADCLPQRLWTFEQICEHTASCTRVAVAAAAAAEMGDE